MKLLRWLGVAYVGILLVNIMGCEAPHTHRTEVLNERVVEQQEVVE